MTSKSERLAVLSDAEQFAPYGLPDFDDGQQLEFLSLSEAELALASCRPGLHAQVYFKAKQAFFRFTWDDAQDDCAYVLTRYFNGQTFEPNTITEHEYYTQRALIAELFGYRIWSANFLPQLVPQTAQIVRRDVTSSFIVAELIAYLNEHKIVRPGYTTLQTLISEAMSAERLRLGRLVAEVLDTTAKDALAQLLVRVSDVNYLGPLATIILAG